MNTRTELEPTNALAATEPTSARTLILANTAPLPLDQNAAAVYLASLAPGSRRTMRDATVDFGRTRARAPFDAEIPVIAVLDTTRALQGAPDLDAIETERVVLGAANWSWNLLK